MSRWLNRLALLLALGLAVPFLRQAFERAAVSLYFVNGHWGMVSLWLHLLASSVALLLGLLCLLNSVARIPSWCHRTLGWVYVVAVALAITGGMALLPFADRGGMLGRLGLGYGLALWSLSTFQMVRQARRRDYTQHRRWAYRSYALTFSGITLRFILKTALGLGWADHSAYALAACSCFVVNLSIVELLWARHGLPQHYLPLSRLQPESEVLVGPHPA